jgi:hypothetical protein
MNVLGTDPPFDELAFSNIFNKFLECPKTPYFGSINSRQNTVVNNTPEFDINSVKDGVINDEPIQGPPNLLVNITLLPHHQIIIDDLFARYRQGILQPLMVKRVELHLHRELISYPAQQRSFIRLQLAALHAASYVQNVLNFSRSLVN